MQPAFLTVERGVPASTDIPALPVLAVDADRRLIDASVLADGVPPILRPAMVKGRGWACLAVEDELQGDAVSRLANACAAYGFTSAWSVEVRWTQGVRRQAAHRFAISARALQSLSEDSYIGSCYILAEAAGGFAVASDGVVAGPLGFVESAAGLPVGEALARFGRTARSYGETLAGSRLTAVHEAALSARAAAQA